VRGYDPLLSFLEDTAAVYDDHPRGDEAETVAFLARLAGGGPALELAIGTGRIALPLAERGTPISGIDISQPMVDRLRQKPGGDCIPVTIGDFADVPVNGAFRLIFVVYNTLFNLLTQDDQVRCFVNVEKHLENDGVFVIETFTPNWLYRLRDDQYVDAERIEASEVTLDVGRHNPVTQTLDESHVHLTPNGITVFPIVCRYAWPSELDLMARIAGLRLHERWGGWLGEPYTAESRRHVSVYGR
jgi:hypothetical protein